MKNIFVIHLKKCSNLGNHHQQKKKKKKKKKNFLWPIDCRKEVTVFYPRVLQFANINQLQHGNTPTEKKIKEAAVMLPLSVNKIKCQYQP